MRIRDAHAALWLTSSMSVILFGTGCDNAAAQRRQLGSSNPLDRADAVVTITRAGDLAAVHKLVDLLDDPDRAVRMYSILGLRRLCGEDFGYRYYAASGERAPAVLRWREALRSGTVAVNEHTHSAEDDVTRVGIEESTDQGPARPTDRDQNIPNPEP